MDVASSYGARVIKRPKNISGDKSKTEETILHFIESISDVRDFACVQATTPMVESKHLQTGFDLLNNYDSVISVVEMTEYLWSKDRTPVNFEVSGRQRTQDMTKLYSENGSFYITTKNSFIKRNLLYDGKVGFVVMPKMSSFEIDTEEDWELVSKCMK